MRRVIAHGELPLDQLGYPLGGPDVPAIATGLRSWLEQTWQLGQLLRTQLGLRAWGWVPTQGFHSCFSPSFEPLTHRSLGHSQGLRNILLFPALPFQLRGASAASLFPIFLLLLFPHASILPPLATCAAISR